MKLGITISTEKVSFNAIVYNGTGLEDSVRELSGLGYRGVDLFAGFISHDEAKRMRELFNRYDVEIPMFLPIKLSEGGCSFTHPDKAVRNGYLANYVNQMKIAALLGSTLMPIGFSRGKKGPDRSCGEYYSALGESIRKLAEKGVEYGITLCLEPINRYEMDVLNSTDECLDFFDEYRINNVKLLLDVFHMNIEDHSLENSILRAGSRIGHFHAADSNRFGAGKGHVDHMKLLSALKQVNYEGYLSIEAIPGDAPDAPYECARTSAEFLRNALADSGIFLQ